MIRKEIFLKIFIFIILILSLNIFNLYAQQINPPKIIRIKVMDCLGLAIGNAAISIDFKALGVTKVNGEFSFENNGGILSISKIGYVTKIIQLPSYWKGDLNINLEKNEIRLNNEKPNYTRKILLNNIPLINKNMILIENKSNYFYYMTDQNGLLNINYEKNSKVFLIYIEEKQNNIFIYFSELKEIENNSILILNYNINQEYYFDFENNITPNSILINGSNILLRFPFYIKTNVKTPYKIYLGSNDYDFFNKYEIFFEFTLSFIKINQILKLNFIDVIDKQIQSIHISFCIKPKDLIGLNERDLADIFNQKVNHDFDNNFIKNLYSLFDYHFSSEKFFEFNINDNEYIKLVKLKVYDFTQNLIIEGFLYNNIKIPQVFFEKKYYLQVEMYPGIFYDNLISDSNILGKESILKVVFQLK